MELLTFQPLVHAAFVRSLADEASDALIKSAHVSEDELADIQMSLRTYFNTGLEVNGAFVWKAVEPVASLSGDYLRIFQSDDGWYCSNVLFETRSAMRAAKNEHGEDVKIIFWSRPRWLSTIRGGPTGRIWVGGIKCSYVVITCKVRRIVLARI